jgi:hypothetical protein
MDFFDYYCYTAVLMGYSKAVEVYIVGRWKGARSEEQHTSTHLQKHGILRPSREGLSNDRTAERSPDMQSRRANRGAGNRTRPSSSQLVSLSKEM